jgi:excisionase family DNA binding protein
MNGDGDHVVAHLVLALDAQRKWCRSRGMPFPPALAALLDSLAVELRRNRPEAARSGPDRSHIAGVPISAEAEPVPQPLCVDDRAAALLLGLSGRSVRRFRKDGTLPTVQAGRRRLIRLTDVEAFVANGGTQ